MPCIGAIIFLRREMKIVWIVIICMHLPILSADYSQLTYDQIMTPDWLKLASESQYQKDRALKNAICMPNPYPEKRKYIAAAIYAGASVPIVQLRTSSGASFKLMPLAAMMQDLPLIKLLLKNGADVDERMDNNFPAIYFARTCDTAKPLIDKGALDILTENEQKELLLRTLGTDFDAGLIKLYQQHYSNSDYPQSIMRDCVHNTPLMRLVMHANQNMVKKAEALLDSLTPKQIYFYITTINYFCENVFNLIAIEKEKRNARGIQNLQDLEQFLVDKLHESTCAICFDPLDTRTCAYTNGHKLHATCASWAKRVAPISS